MNSRKLYFQTLIVLLLVAVLLILMYGQSFAFFPVQGHHPFWLNIFFINYTFMGNGLFVIGLSGVFIFRLNRKQQGMTIFYAFLVAGMAVQLIKNINNIANPALFIEQGQYLFHANTISLIEQSNLISGHSTMAFALATVVSLTMKDPKWQLLLLAAAVLVGYSRIYLEQAFLSEILIGALVGMISGIAAVYLGYYLKGLGYYFKKSFHFHKSNTMPGERNIQTV